MTLYTLNDIIRTYRHPFPHQQRALALAQVLAQALAHSGGDQGCACAHPLPKDPHK